MSDNSDSKTRRRQPKQTRSIETRNSILDAAAELFASAGYEQTTTHQVAGQAEVSVGALYRYFADKEAILKDLYRREITELRTSLVREFSSADLMSQDVQQLVRQTLTLAFKVYSRRPGLMRVLGEQSRKVPDLARMRGSQEAELHRAIGTILGAVPNANLPDRLVGSYLIRLFLESLIEDHVFYQRSEFTDEQVIEASADFILRYILGRIS
jgi:AcrR family transcriptional regulator